MEDTVPADREDASSEIEGGCHEGAVSKMTSDHFGLRGRIGYATLDFGDAI